MLWWRRGSHQGSSPELSGAEPAAAAKNLAEVTFGCFLPPLPGGIRPHNTSTVPGRLQTPAAHLQRWRDWDALPLFPDVPVSLLKVGHKRSGWGESESSLRVDDITGGFRRGWQQRWVGVRALPLRPNWPNDIKVKSGQSLFLMKQLLHLEAPSLHSHADAALW